MYMHMLILLLLKRGDIPILGEKLTCPRNGRVVNLDQLVNRFLF